jgi:hypothetical protein
VYTSLKAEKKINAAFPVARLLSQSINQKQSGNLGVAVKSSYRPVCCKLHNDWLVMRWSFQLT